MQFGQSVLIVDFIHCTYVFSSKSNRNLWLNALINNDVRWKCFPVCKKRENTKLVCVFVDEIGKNFFYCFDCLCVVKRFLFLLNIITLEFIYCYRHCNLPAIDKMRRRRPTCKKKRLRILVVMTMAAIEEELAVHRDHLDTSSDISSDRGQMEM